MKRKRIFYAVIALATMAVGVAIFLLTGDVSSDRTKTLPDGSVLTLRRITTGTNHHYVSGNLLQRAAARVFPESWAEKLGAKVTRYNTGTPTSVYWLECITSTNALRIYGPSTAIGVHITNQAGFDKWYIPVAYPGESGYGYLLDAVPTDSPHIRFAVGRNMFDLDSHVTFEVPNPTFVPHRTWQPSPCPIVVEQDDVSVDLERFITGVRKSPGARVRPSTEAAFVVRDRAVPTNNWFALVVRLFNEAGDEFPPYRVTDASMGRTGASFPFGLSSAEPYKLRFELRRSSYGPDDQHIFRAVPVPKATRLPLQPLSARLQGFTLVVNLTPDGTLSARIEPPAKQWRLEPVRVVDDRGRWLHARGESTYDGQFSGSIPLEPDTATVDLTFGLARQRTIEVIAQPSLPK